MEHAQTGSNLSMINFLLLQGLKPTQKTLELFWLQAVADFWAVFGSSYQNFCLDLARLLTANSTHLLIDDVSIYIEVESLTLTSASHQLVGSVFPPYRDSLPLYRWENFASAVRGIFVATPELLLPWLGQSDLDASFLRQLGPQGCWQMLLDIVFLVGDLKPQDREAQNFWRRLLSSAVNAGLWNLLSIVHVTPELGSPLLHYCDAQELPHFGYLGKGQQIPSSDLRMWLQILADAGIELQQYGQLERAIHLCRRKNILNCRDDRHPEIHSVEITGLSFGKKVDDWCLWLHCPLDEWAAEFWALIEPVTEMSVPGSWIDEAQERRTILDNERRAMDGAFKGLATSQRKRRRYFRYVNATNTEAQKSLGKLWENMIPINKKYGPSRQGLHNWPPLTQRMPKQDYLACPSLWGENLTCRDCDQRAIYLAFSVTKGEVDPFCWRCFDRLHDWFAGL